MSAAAAKITTDNKDINDLMEAAILGHEARNQGKEKLATLTLNSFCADLEKKASCLEKENKAALAKFDAEMAKQYGAFTKHQADDLKIFTANQHDAFAAYKEKIRVEKELGHPKWSLECRTLLAASKKLANEKHFEAARDKQNSAYDLQKEEQEAWDKKQSDHMEYLTNQFKEKQEKALQAFSAKQAIDMDKLNAANAARREHLVAIQEKEVAIGNKAGSWSTAHVKAGMYSTHGIEVWVGPRVVPYHLDTAERPTKSANIPGATPKLNAKSLENDKTKFMHSKNTVQMETNLLAKL